ncbi:MAG: GNAT family N-acetyltransferase [Gammaproteobacteria bacterium]
MNESIIVKYAVVSDALEVALINVASWQHGYHGIIPNEILDNLPTQNWAASWKVYLEGNGKLLLIIKSGKILGFAKIGENSSLDAGEISAIYLLPEIWRQGFGSKLCIASIAELKKMGFNKIVLWVLARNRRACDFYEAMGFSKGLSRICPLFPPLNLEEIQYVMGLDVN